MWFKTKVSLNEHSHKRTALLTNTFTKSRSNSLFLIPISAHPREQLQTLGVLSIMPNRPVRDRWEFPSKMERYCPIKPDQPIGMALATVCFSSEFPDKGKEPVVRNGTTIFGRNIPTEICGPPPEVIPNIPVRRNRNGLFHFNSNRKFRNLWHNGKHPWRGMI